MCIPRSLRFAATAIVLGASATLLVGPVAGAGTPQLSKSAVQTQAAKILASKTRAEAAQGHLPEWSRRQGGGQANQAKFCADNSTITSALSAATTHAAFLSALQANEQVILDLQATAPAHIVDSPGT
jgi:hypothetical protein